MPKSTSSEIKINYAHAKKLISQNYLQYLDIFYKCLAINLSSMLGHKSDVFIVDEKHNLLYLNISSTNTTLDYLLSSSHLIEIYKDLSLYLDAFIIHSYNYCFNHYYSVSIDEDLSVVVKVVKILKTAKPHQTLETNSYVYV